MKHNQAMTASLARADPLGDRMTNRRWQGLTVACIASGPSLRAEDCRLIESAGIPVIAVNSSWKAARFAQVIYAGDPEWWQQYGKEIDIPAERWTHNPNAAQSLGIKANGKGSSVLNSGYRAIELAIELGATRVLLLGYDCSVAAGTHWHGDHDKTKNPDAKRCAVWLNQFAKLDMRWAQVVNCSRETSLTCFPRMTLEGALCL